MGDRQPLAVPEEVAEYLRVKNVQTLANWRHSGIGPPYVKTEGSVRYRWSDVEAWLNSHAVTPGMEA